MWYERYGFKENPFSVKANSNIVGVEKQKNLIKDYILSGDMCFLLGGNGTGKSSLLYWLKESLNGFKVLYIDAAQVDKNFNLSNFLKSNLTIFERIKRKKFPDKAVVLLDESQEAGDELVKALKMHWDHNNIRSVVVTQINKEAGKFSESFRDRVGERRVVMEKISKSDAYDMINKRVSEKNPFEKEALELIFEKSDYTPRKILENCEILCVKLQDKEGKINAFDVEQNLIKTFKIDENVSGLVGFSPMQGSIINMLSEGVKTAKEISERLNTSEGSVGKQLSKLIGLSVVEIKENKRPKKYGLIKRF